ncbi:Aerobic respiration control sensor protein ArcB [Lacipirellula limnantheis]|uniref:histidine kinase n=1 Tax=Lacipirellula limnantheis TaxID=2528024 RepID=A0A517TSM3_9BACT|nr:Aerobic respiration control sensor protein ArcB [Lacipirellula limnantheis]
MPSLVRSLKPHLIAIAAVAVAAAARYLLNRVLPPGAVPFITFFPAVVLASWYGGLWPGVTAAVAAYLTADWCFVPPDGLAIVNGNDQALIELAMFSFMAALIVALAHHLHQANARARSAAADADHRGEMLRITLASIGDGVIATDPEGCVTFMNAVAEAQTGWTSAEAGGKPIADVFHIVNEQTRQIVENPCELVLRTGKVVGLANHTILIARDGTERPIEDSAAPIMDATGRIYGMILVFTDATYQRKTQSALQQLAAIVEHSDDAVISKNLQGIITSWNDAAQRLYGFTAEEAVGRHISLIVPDHHRDELAVIMERLSRGERIDHWDTTRMRKDGSLVDVSLRISPIKNPYGEVVGASKVARDVSQRKRTEEALQFLADTSASLAALIDRGSALQQAAASMIPFFADWCVVYALRPDGSIGNPASAHRDPAKQQLLRDFLAEYPVDWDSPSVTVQAWRTGKTQFIPQLTDEQLRKLGRNDRLMKSLWTLKPQSVISVPLKIRERTIGVISFVQSESTRPYVEADIPLAEDLARRVATALDNAQLLSSIRESERQKDEFLAMLAHELRNPLAAIRYAADAASLPAPESNGEMLDVINRQANNLTRIIDSLLDISRISQEKIQLRREQIDAATIIERAAMAIQPILEERGDRLRVELADEPLPLFVDATRAEQIIANLLTNAAKYSPEGSEVTLQAFAREGEAVIQVIDHGIGISAEMLPRVFDLFAQADRTLDRSQGGLGIGLTVVRKLAEMHGGAVSAHSDGEGQGSTFTVRLPLSEAAKPMSFAPVDATAPPAALNVLVVDDNRDTAQAEAMLLKMHGHKVTVAHDGRSALELFESIQPDAVLLDIGLPVINGYDVAAKLRERGYKSQLLIAVSGYGQTEDRERSLRAGFDHHLVKPVDVRDLLALLHAPRV